MREPLFYNLQILAPDSGKAFDIREPLGRALLVQGITLVGDLSRFFLLGVWGFPGDVSSLL